MQVGISAQVATAQDAAFVREAERLGAASVWVPEAWAPGRAHPAGLPGRADVDDQARLIGIVQIGARSPAMLAMSALSLQLLSGGRFLLGLGTSGPQVMEGWHGVRFGSPLAATRETIEIVRQVAARRPARARRRGLPAAAARRPRPGAPVDAAARARSRSTSPRSGRATWS